MKQIDMIPKVMDDVGAEGPGHICLNDNDLKNLRGYKNMCDTCKMDLRDTKAAYQGCIDAGKPAHDWWADPRIVVGGVVVSFSVGLLIGVFATR